MTANSDEKKIVGYNFDQHMYILNDGSLLHPLEKITVEDKYYRDLLAGAKLLFMLKGMDYLNA